MTIPEITLAEKLLRIRKTFRVSRSSFSLMTGITSESLTSYELRRVPWRAENVQKVKNALHNHVSLCVAALKEIDC